MIAGHRRVLFHHHLIGQFYRIIQIQHGKNLSVTGRNPACLQRFQAHLKAWIAFLLPFARHTVQMVEAQDEGADPLCFPVVLADFFSLRDRHGLKPSWRDDGGFWNIIVPGSAVHIVG